MNARNSWGMTPRRFAWALQARGLAISTWPLRERMGAMALLRHCKMSRELLAEALAAEDAPAWDEAALDRVTCPVRRALAPLTPLMRSIRWGGIVACMAAGLYIGAVTSGGDTVADLLPVMHPSMPATVLAALEP
jgi:hypothetical protein